MALLISQLLVWVLGGYAGLGVVFALAFVARGMGRVDHAARGAPWSFRLIIFPGVAALWPWMLVRWCAASKEERHDAA